MVNSLFDALGNTEDYIELYNAAKEEYLRNLRGLMSSVISMEDVGMKPDTTMRLQNLKRFVTAAMPEEIDTAVKPEDSVAVTLAEDIEGVSDERS